ncbi:MAG: M23 family metallopeptidase [Spirochaeta sp.]
MTDTQIGRAWSAAGEIDSSDPILVATPFEERRLMDPREPQAAYYLVEGLRGHRLDIQIDGPVNASYFLDAFRLPQEYRPQSQTDAAVSEGPWNTGEYEPAVSAGGIQSGSSELFFEPRQHRFYLIRLQPAVLEGGEFRVRITADAALSWPVPGTDYLSIWSVFGAPRDGGLRIHHGVDIFAPRHTPLVTISENSRVSRVGQRDRGGKIVSLVDEDRDLMLYYAHLEDQDFDLQGTDIPAGTEIGTMGNSGNAITTPPHLHIGIYEGGWRNPVDPWYFIVPLDTRPAPPDELNFALGEYIRLNRDDVGLLAYPGQRSSIIPSPAVTDGDGEGLPSSAYPLIEIPASRRGDLQLREGTVLQAVGVWGGYVQVLAPDGVRGFLPLSAIVPANDVQGLLQQEIAVDGEQLLHERVGGILAPVAAVAAGSRVQELGSYAGLRLVQAENGDIGWMQ